MIEVLPQIQKGLETLFAERWSGWKLLGVVLATPTYFRCLLEKNGQKKTANVYCNTGFVQPERIKTMWDVDFVQFARLLDEINAVGLTEDQVKAVATSMEVEPKDVRQIMNRAASRWEDLKPLLLKKTPLTEEQVSEELATDGKVTALVTIELDEIVGHLEDDAMDCVFDDLSTRVAGDVDLDDIEYKVLFADNDTLYVRVSGKPDNMEDGEDEEEEGEAETPSDVEPS